MTLLAGNHLGPYSIVALLGAGRMGEVYRARDPRLDRDVAIKVLHLGSRKNAEARARFRLEALALSRLNHPNIEMVLDLGAEGGVDYLVLEFVPGETLSARISRGRVPEREGTELCAQVAEALAEAHERVVLHRDLKPGDVMLTPKGRAKVLDFGLAKLAPTGGDATRSIDLTQAGVTLGTLAYMAPEQLLGEPLDARADLYALGVLLYELTTGRRPFLAAIHTALTNEILHGRLKPPRSFEPALSPRAEGVILRAMLATAHALAGRGHEARALLAEIDSLSARRYVAAYYPAQVLVALGERDAAFAALDRAFDERVHWLAGIRIDPSLAPLRDDPRFGALVSRSRPYAPVDGARAPS